MGGHWKVVGGADKGGILVREGRETSSAQVDERLSTDSLVEEVELVGERLHYKKISGAGPAHGWVSLSLKGKTLCEKVEAEDAAEPSKDEPPIPEDAPRYLQPGNRIGGQLKECPFPKPLKKTMAKKKFVEQVASQRLKGELYGLPFPSTPEELFDESKYGVNWLNSALHAAGSLSEDNSITKVLTWKRFIGGGSGPKAIFEVEIEKPDPNFDTKLFLKVPYTLEENEKMRFMESGQFIFGDLWGGELHFNRFCSTKVGFPVPKFYFGDINRDSTEAILINSCVEWPEKEKTEFGPYEVFPPAGKCEDYLLIGNPADYYMAIFRRMGQFAGEAKAGKLGPEFDKIKWYENTPTNDMFCAPSLPGSELNLKKFVQQVAPHWFPSRVKQESFMKTLCEKMAECSQEQTKIAEYLYNDPLYMGLHHINGNSDNCYFYKDANGRMDAGVLDWGSCGLTAYGTAFMGTTVSAQGEMLAEYDDKLIQCWCDAYHATGAPRLNMQETLLRYRLATCIPAGFWLSAVNPLVTPKEIAGNKQKFKAFSAWNCDEIRADFQMKFGMGMLYSRVMMMFLKGDTYWSALTTLNERVK